MNTKIRYSSEQVSWLVELKVRPEHLSAFRELSEEMAQAALTEAGTLLFERYVDGENKSVHLIERYVDSHAAMVHLANFREQFARRFSPLVERIAFRVYGQASDELTMLLTELLAPLSLNSMPLLVGFNRGFDSPISGSHSPCE